MDQREAQRRAGSGLPVYMSRALVSLGGMLFLGLGLGMYVHKGASLLWILGLLATLVLVLVLMARWQVATLTVPLEQLLGGTEPRAIEDLPRAWSNLERENQDLRDRAAREDSLLPGIMARLEEGVLLFGATGTLEQFNPACLLYTSPSPRDGLLSRMPSSA